MLDSVKRPKISDVVVDRLKEYIVANRLKPGDRLPTEQDLAERFGISRVSVREATKALGYLGILDARPGRGLTVGRVDSETVQACLSFHPALHDVDPDQMIDSRAIIELGVLPYVAKRMATDPSIYERLNAINDELRRTHELSRWIELDIAYHRLLVESSGLAPLAAFNELIQVFFHRFRESVKKGQMKSGIEEQQRIIDALRDGKVVVATEILRGHIESHRGRLDE